LRVGHMAINGIEINPLRDDFALESRFPREFPVYFSP
jgi:hypothetical protein